MSAFAVWAMLLYSQVEAWGAGLVVRSVRLWRHGEVFAIPAAHITHR